MAYRLDFSVQANKDIDFHQKSGNKALLKKLFVLLEELTEHPTSGTGKPEQLNVTSLAIGLEGSTRNTGLFIKSLTTIR